ncbi:MAG: hypothetical protein LUG18_02465 [Candidatus Azobacteroides sp.]|nr:hypothetical protein [Candidatus Azobacteroides sp.]
MNTFNIKQVFSLLFSFLLVQAVYGKTAETTQKDSLLQREMFLEAEYNPTIRDANKVNILPEVEDPKPVKADIDYSSWAVTITPDREVATLKAEHFGTEEMRYGKKGYLTLEGGYTFNLRGAAGYEILNTEEDFFRISLNHFSTHGNVKYVQGDTKEKAKLNDNLFHAFYKHRFESLDLYADLNYGYTGFNYYGYGFDLPIPDKMQVFQLVNPRAGIKSTHDGSLQYEAELDYRYSSKKYTAGMENDGLKESDIFTRFDISNQWESNFRLGLSADMHNLFYNGAGYLELPGDYSNFGITPYFRMEDEDQKWRARIGIRTDISTKGDNKIVISPDLLAEFDVYEGTWIYAMASGGKNILSQAAVMRENRYLNPDTRLMDSRTPVDARLGMRTSALDKWFFNVYGRYKITKDDHYYYRTGAADNYFFNAFEAGYYDKSHLIQVGGKIAFNHQDYIGVSVEVAKNFWTTEFTHPYYSETITKPINLPDVEMKVLLEATIIPQLKANIGFDWLNGRYSFDEMYFGATKMDDIQNLHMGATYVLNRSLSLCVQLSNILNKKYDYWYSYPEQGISAMAEFTFLF